MRYLFFLIVMYLIVACKTEPSSLKTASGYTYTHHVNNNGTVPQSGELAEFEIVTRVDEKLVNSTRQTGNPAQVLIPGADQPAGSVSPVVEALKLMSVGDSLTIQQSMDSFPRRPPGFEDAQFVYYDIVLTGISSKEEVAKQRAEMEAKMQEIKAKEAEIAKLTKGILDKYTAKNLTDLETTKSGLKYHIIEKGDGKQVEQGNRANVHYYGMTTDGNEFDNSYKKGSPFPLNIGVGQVIKGWDEGLQLFTEGTKAVLFIPSDLGYGATGSPPSIPPNAELVFYIEMVEIL